MSRPISECLISKAVRNEEAFQELVKAMRINKAYGHYTCFPCKHAPPCLAPTEQEMDDLNKRLVEATKDVQLQSFYRGVEGPKGVCPDE